MPFSKQIPILKVRGLSLDCYEEEKIKEILLDIGYYRIGFYCFSLIDLKEPLCFKKNLY